MRVFVLNRHCEALMPCKPRKAKILLREEKAKVLKRNPFTIQLKYGSSGYRQGLTLGVDTGHTEVGISVVSETKEVLLISMLKTLLPITKVVLETGTFDMAKMNNPDITNEQYQQGVQYGFENVKAYVLARDGYKCQCGKSGCSDQLEVHHVTFRSKGGSDAPGNLLTLCQKHHASLHDGKIKLNVTKHKALRSATTMNVIRSRVLALFPDAIETFGYVTKANRHHYCMEKSHSNDAFVIAGGSTQERLPERRITFKRKNNRSLQKNRNGFAPAIRRQRYKIQPQDIIEWNGIKCIAKGMQNKGAYLAFMHGTKRLVKNIKTIKLIFQNKGTLYA